jgi:cytochrome c peroxidase
VLLTACEESATPVESLATIDGELRQSLSVLGYGPVLPIGPVAPQSPAQVELGRALFFDRILSGNRDIACATCHHPSTALGDGRSLSVGTGGSGLGPERTLGQGRELVPRGAPSLLNVGLGLPYLMWDGRLSGAGPFGGAEPSVTLQGAVIPPGLPGPPLVAQAFLPVLDRREMRGEPGDTDALGNVNELAELADDQHVEIWRAIMARLLAIPEYVEMFHAAYPSAPPSLLTYEHAARAIAAFETDAFTKTRSPFDLYLDGDDNAMTTRQKRGALLFLGDALCSTCHSGPLLGGQRFANTGAPQIGPGVGASPPLDLGRGELPDHDFYRFAFRTPPLRNVELTAPYMHSGAYATLEAVVRHYGDVQEAAREYDVTQLDPALRDLAHTDEPTVAAVLETLDHQLRVPLDLDDQRVGDLVAFLESLTDPGARDLGRLVPESVPSGLPVED